MKVLVECMALIARYHHCRLLKNLVARRKEEK